MMHEVTSARLYDCGCIAAAMRLDSLICSFLRRFYFNIFIKMPGYKIPPPNKFTFSIDGTGAAAARWHRKLSMAMIYIDERMSFRLQDSLCGHFRLLISALYDGLASFFFIAIGTPIPAHFCRSHISLFLID